jgi:sugar phosphate isomerase/epimerase
MQLGLCTISSEARSVEEVFRVAADAGYDGVELWGKEPHIGDGSQEVTASIVGTASDLSLDIATYGSYLVAGADSFRDEYEHELAVAKRLGADLLRVWPGESEYEDCTESEWQAAVEDLSLLADRAASANLAVTVEKHEGRLSNATEGARRLIEAVDHPNCGLNWQPLFHMDETALLTEAERLAPLSNNVHMQAPAERGRSQRALLEDAYFDVAAVLDRFADMGFDGYVEVEFVSEDAAYETAVRRDHDYLRDALGDSEQ